MLKEQIVVGKSYVNEDAGLIREVTAELDKRRVKANTFDLATGKLVPTRHSVWIRSQLADWATRETTPPETARIHPFERAAWFDVLMPPDHAGTSLDQVKTTLEGTPGHHAVIRIK